VKIRKQISIFILVFTIFTSQSRTAFGYIDIGVSVIVQPTCSVVPGSLQQVIVVITNFGSTPVTTVPVSYILNSDPTVTATYTGLLAPLTSDTFDLFPYFIVPGGPFTLCSFTDGDTIPANDTTCISCSGSAMSINPNQNSSENGIIVKPNPTSGTFLLKTEDKLAYNSSVVITNVLGKVVWTSDFIKPEYYIDISNEPGGVYLIHLKSASGILRSRLILAR